MKKILYVLTIFVLMSISTPAFAAKSVKVSALTPFNSLRPVFTMKVMTLERAEFKNGIVFEDGTVIDGVIYDVKQPKRGKLNASFKFRPISYTYNGKTTKIEDPEFVAKYAEFKELDKAGLATSAATTAGGMIFKIPMLSEGVSFAKGVWKNPENNRIKSGAVQVYKDSFLSYVEEGKDVVINKEQMFILKFKSSDLEDLDETPPNNVSNPEETSQSQSVQTAPPVVPSAEVKTAEEAPLPQEIETKPIHAVSPEDVLKEVELNTK